MPTFHGWGAILLKWHKINTFQVTPWGIKKLSQVCVSWDLWMCWGEAHVESWWGARAQQTQWNSPPSLSFTLISGQSNNCWVTRPVSVPQYLLGSCWSKTWAPGACLCWWQWCSSTALLLMPSLSLQVGFVHSSGVCPTGRFHVAPWLGSERFNSWDFEVTGTLFAPGLPRCAGVVALTTAELLGPRGLTCSVGQLCHERCVRACPRWSLLGHPNSTHLQRRNRFLKVQSLCTTAPSWFSALTRLLRAYSFNNIIFLNAGNFPRKLTRFLNLNYLRVQSRWCAGTPSSYCFHAGFASQSMSWWCQGLQPLPCSRSTPGCYRAGQLRRNHVSVYTSCLIKQKGPQ